MLPFSLDAWLWCYQQFKEILPIIQNFQKIVVSLFGVPDSLTNNHFVFFVSGSGDGKRERMSWSQSVACPALKTHYITYPHPELMTILFPASHFLILALQRCIPFLVINQMSL